LWTSPADFNAIFYAICSYRADEREMFHTLLST
jgi:hypothetical protein